MKLAIQLPEFENSPINVTVSTDVLLIATNISRMLRNLCCSNTHNQSAVIDFHLLPIVLFFNVLY